MKTKTPSLLFLTVCHPIILLVLLAGSLGATTYYVDSVGGSDSNNGTSTNSAWQTLAKVNATTFAAGDQILFKAGGVWSGTTKLHPLGSGSSGNPIVINSYGSGAKPVINAGTATGNGAVYLSNQQYWEINNLEIINNDSSDGDRRGVHILNSSAGTTLNHIYIKNCYIHDIRGKAGTSDGDISAKRTGGIVVESTSTTAKYNDILIEGNTIANVRNQGIVACINGNGGSTLNNEYPGTPAWEAMKCTSVVIRGNTISEVYKNGMIIRNTDESGLVEYNVCYNTANATTGNTMFTSSARGTVFQYNEGYNNLAGSVRDGSTYDADLRSFNIVFQYSYSHDNSHGLFWQYPNTDGPNSGVICRYNISQNDQGIIFAFSGDSGASATSYLYNNTIYIPNTGASQLIFDHRSATHTYYCYNNIFYILNTGATYDFGSDTKTFDYNVFYGQHPASEPSDAHKLTSNPLLVSPGSGGTGRTTVDGYKLQAGSPCIDSGKEVSGNGGLDYWGGTVPYNGTTDRGAHEYSGGGTNVPPSIVTQPQSQTVSVGANVTFSVTASGTAPLAYQWRKNGANIGGATSSSYSLTSVTTNDAGNYTVVVTNAYGSVTSSVATLTVTTGGGASSVVIAEVYCGGGKTGATYQNDFVVLKNASSSAVNINGWSLQHDKANVWQTPFALPNATIPVGGYFLIKCYNDGTANGSALPTPDATTPQSSAWNLSTTVGGAVALVNNTTTLSSCSAASIVDLVGYVSTANNCYEGSGVAPTGSATQSDLRASNGCQDTGDNAADFSLGTPTPENSGTTPASCGGGGCTAPSITAQPADATVCAGSTAAFSVTATGTSLTYQWQLSVGGGAYGNISGATSSTYTTPATVVGDDGNLYRCVVSNACGTATSVGAILTVNSRPTSVVSGGGTICSGGSVAIQAALTGTGPWNVTWSDSYVQNGVATSPATRNVSPASTTTYTVTALTDANCTAQAGDRTGSAVVTVNTAPGITTQPQSQTKTVGESVTFSVTATGTTPLAYQWRKGGVNIGGATSSSYSITSVTTNDAGSYDVVVTNACGSVTSSTATLTVNPAGGGLPAPWQTADIGAVGIAGSASESGGTYTVKGSGAGITGTADQFRYVYQTMSGDGSITVRLQSQSGTLAAALAGVMVRETTNANSKFGLAARTGSGSKNMLSRRRTTTGGNVSSTTSTSQTPPNCWVRVTRTGNSIAMARSTNGTSWTTINTSTITMATDITVGILVTSGSNTVLDTDVFNSVTVVP